MEPAELILFLGCKNFCSPYKAALSKTPLFLPRAEAYVRDLVAGALPFQPQMVEGWIGTKNDAPSSPELERLTRDFFSLEMLAFAVDRSARVRADVRFDTRREALRIRDRRDALAIDPIALPDGEWLDWFLESARCPSCRLFPDFTDEYLPCHLCGYADYAEAAEAARDRFSRATETPALVAAIQGLVAAAKSEDDPLRATYLRYRLHELWAIPRRALEPVPW